MFLPERKTSLYDLTLLSAADIKEWHCFKLFQTWTDKKMIELMFFRHIRFLGMSQKVGKVTIFLMDLLILKLQQNFD